MDSVVAVVVAEEEVVEEDVVADVVVVDLANHKVPQIPWKKLVSSCTLPRKIWCLNPPALIT